MYRWWPLRCYLSRGLKKYKKKVLIQASTHVAQIQTRDFPEERRNITHFSGIFIILMDQHLLFIPFRKDSIVLVKSISWFNTSERLVCGRTFSVGRTIMVDECGYTFTLKNGPVAKSVNLSSWLICLFYLLWQYSERGLSKSVPNRCVNSDVGRIHLNTITSEQHYWMLIGWSQHVALNTSMGLTVNILSAPCWPHANTTPIEHVPTGSTKFNFILFYLFVFWLNLTFQHSLRCTVHTPTL